MNYYSTKDRNTKYSLRDAVLKGIPDDRGLFVPEYIPVLDESFINALSRYSFSDIANKIAQNILEGDLPEDVIERITREAINFPAPVVSLSNNFSILELFHGPTLAFKDFGARFMAGLMSYLVKDENTKLTILVATSGDTGGAVANGFLNKEGVEVIVLYPSGKVSHLQELQLTTLDNNITALEINGTFDDCQEMVKSAFLDPDLRNEYNLSSANSINISRLIPQSFYYFEGYKQVMHHGLPVVFSVPSGNFGNLTAGIIAKKMGLPITKFIASVNSNAVFTDYIQSGEYHPAKSITTLSNAMDVGAPSNFDRLMHLYPEITAMRKDISSFSFSDEETSAEIRRLLHDENYLIDPHGAVGMLGARKHAESVNEKYSYVILETAHPAKFDTVMEKILDHKIEIPQALSSLEKKEKHAVQLNNSFADLKQWLLS